MLTALNYWTYAEKYRPIDCISARNQLWKYAFEHTFCSQNRDRNSIIPRYLSHIFCDLIIFILRQSIEFMLFIDGNHCNLALDVKRYGRRRHLEF